MSDAPTLAPSPAATAISGERFVALFGRTHDPRLSALRRRSLAGIVEAAESGSLRALVLDARSALDASRATDLLRTLYDDPRRSARPLHPGRILALIATGDVETALALGRYGILGVVEERALDGLWPRLARLLAAPPTTSPLTTPALAPARSTRLAPRAPGEPPTVTIGHRHAPETLELLARYVGVLRAHAAESTVFADVASLIEVMVDDGLTCQTNLAAKAGATHEGQFIGSFEFYRELRRTRYAHLTDPPDGAPAMEVFIAVDEVVHEVLHLLFLANALRAGLAATGTHVAEELSLTWWQAVVHNRVFPDWLGDRHILEINDDFLLSEPNAEARGFFRRGNVFERYAGYPWVPYVIARLPERASYIGERADLAEVITALAQRPEARFLVDGPRERLEVSIPFDAYPRVPDGLRILGARGSVLEGTRAW